MKMYSAHGINDFVVCLGYRGYVIKEYFANYYLHMCDVSFDLADNRMEVHQSRAEPWRVTLIDTGEQTQTGGRLKRVLSYIDEREFCFTYGDGLSDLDTRALIDFHRGQGTLATVTAVQPPGRYGALEFDAATASPAFRRSRTGTRDGSTAASSCCRRRSASTSRATRRSGSASRWSNWRRPVSSPPFKHDGFWYAMDTLRDKNELESLWASGRAPWKTWEGPAGSNRVLGRPPCSSPGTAASRGVGSASGSVLGAEVVGLSRPARPRGARCTSRRASARACARSTATSRDPAPLGTRWRRSGRRS